MTQSDISNYGARALEEWQANNELFKFHEDLKQKRFSYFFTIQTAFIAFYGLLLKEIVTGGDIVLSVALVVVAIPPMLLAAMYAAMDKRARAYVDTIKGKLLLLESEWRERTPESCFSTYSEQFEVLVHRNEDVVNRYIDARGLGDTDPFHSMIQAGAAHMREERITGMFKFIWAVSFLGAVVGLAWRLWPHF